MVLKLYLSTVTSDLATKKHQQKIEMILTAKKFEYKIIDIAADEGAREKMRELMGNPKGLPPQLFNDDTYLGDFDKFDEAVEDEILPTFLQI